jgi:ketosteroid isomerase-like protein
MTAQTETALRFIEAMGAGNADAAAGCLAPGATTMARNFSRFAGVHDRDEMLGMIANFTALMPSGLRFTVNSVMADGDRVAIECDGDAVTSAGEPYRNQYCFVFRFSGERIKEIHEYFCSKRAEEVLWPLVEAMMPSQTAT